MLKMYLLNKVPYFLCQISFEKTLNVSILKFIVMRTWSSGIFLDLLEDPSLAAIPLRDYKFEQTKKVFDVSKRSDIKTTSSNKSRYLNWWNGYLFLT